MSAWICPDEHINVIVSYFVERNMFEGLWIELDGQYQYLNRETAPKVAQVLYAENVKSVSSRYREEINDKYMGWQYYPQVRELYSQAEIANALNSYDYQSCETDEYPHSQASKIVDSMRKQLLNELVENEEVDTWSINKVKTDGVIRV